MQSRGFQNTLESNRSSSMVFQDTNSACKTGVKVHQVKALASKSDDPSEIPRVHTIEGETNFRKLL